MAPRRKAQKQAPKRAAYGDYYPPDYDVETYTARRQFLRVLDELAPHVLDALVEDVWPIYKRFFQTVADPRNDSWWYLRTLTSQGLREPARGHAAWCAGLYRTLLKWSRAYDLDADWIRDAALYTLWPRVALHWEPGARLTWITLEIGKSEHEDDLPKSGLDFALAPWNPVTKRRSRFEHDARERFEVTLARYLDDVEARVNKAGWRRARVARGRSSNPQSDRHFRWLIQWQVLRWTTTRIAVRANLGRARAGESNPVTPARTLAPSRLAVLNGPVEKKARRDAGYQAVVYGLKTAAERVGLPLRSGNATDRKRLDVRT